MRTFGCLLLSGALLSAQTTSPATDLLARIEKGDRDAAVSLGRRGAEALPGVRQALRDANWWPPANEKSLRWIADLLTDLGPAAVPAFGDVVTAFGLAEKRSGHPGNEELLLLIRSACPLPAEQGKQLAIDLRANARMLWSGFYQTLICLECEPETKPTSLFDSLQDENPCRRIVAAQQVARDSKQWSAEDRESARSAVHTAATAKLPRRISFTIRNGGRVSGTTFDMDAGEYELAFANVLLRLGCTDATTLPALRHRLHHFDPRVRVESVQAIGRLGAEATGALPELIALAKWMTPEGCEAITALGMIGNKEPQVLDVLHNATRSREAQMAARARAALRLLGEQGR